MSRWRFLMTSCGFHPRFLPRLPRQRADLGWTLICPSTASVRPRASAERADRPMLAGQAIGLRAAPEALGCRGGASAVQAGIGAAFRRTDKAQRQSRLATSRRFENGRYPILPSEV